MCKTDRITRKNQVVKTGKSVSIETLIKTVCKHHQQGGSQTSVAKELGITPAAVSLRLKYLRDKGVKGLPEFPRGAGNSGMTVVERAKMALAALGIKG